MNHTANMVGMGCFAKTDTLRQVFSRAIENYILGKYADICPPPGSVLNNENLTSFFKSVIALGAEKPDQLELSSEFIPGTAEITGFFLGLKKRNLHLVVFFSGEGRRQTKFAVRLEKFTRLRKKRLH